MKPIRMDPIRLEAPSTISAIPYCPGLKRVVPNVTCAILVTYLEMRFPAPQGVPGMLSSPPAEVQLDTVRRDLAISRRTLGLNLYALARVYPEEAKRWAAVRAGREFLQPRHRAKAAIKLYSVVTDYNLERAHSIILRRNLPAMRTVFANCGISVTSLNDWAQRMSDESTQHTEAEDKLTKVTTAPALVSSPDSLAGILLRGSVLAGDRRRVRYGRLRKAVESGLEEPGVLSAKQPKRRIINLPRSNDGVEPQLPEDVAARLINLRTPHVKDDLGGATGRRES